jgi:acyl-CoA synthetase (AMP-forming)/AMP-acid ligase II
MAGFTRATSPRWDEDGYFTIVDRKTDMILTAGVVILPRRRFNGQHRLGIDGP